MDCGDHISITMEMPGVDKKDIDLWQEDNELVVKVDTPERKYYNKVPLNADVKPKSIKANYKNGVLNITLKTPKPKRTEKKENKRIDID